MRHFNDPTGMNDIGSQSVWFGAWRTGTWLCVLLSLSLVFGGGAQAAALRVGVYVQVPPDTGK
jgi:hypothetical protein